MTRISKLDWDRVHDLACEIANLSAHDDTVLVESKTGALRFLLKELESKYGRCSQITATIADYATEEEQRSLYLDALQMAKTEGDGENEKLIMETLAQIAAE